MQGAGAYNTLHSILVDKACAYQVMTSIDPSPGRRLWQWKSEIRLALFGFLFFLVLLLFLGLLFILLAFFVAHFTSPESVFLLLMNEEPVTIPLNPL